jgi:hypothetical protein
MEPIKVWEIWIDGPQYTDDEKIARQYSDNPREGVFVPRADFDALVKERDALKIEVKAADCAGRFMEGMRNAATARADKAEAALKDALARIDAHLAAKGQAAPTPADPTNPAPAAASAAGCTERKEP